MKKSINSKKENAVSPVIGVMLMLVVTIVIAAFVAAVATGMFSSSEKAPSASIGVNILYNGGNDGKQCVMLIENKGGDTIPTSDLRIMTYYTSASGTKKGTYKTDHTALNANKLTLTKADGTTGTAAVPILADAAKGDITGTNILTSNQALNFGNYNFAPGTVMTTYSNEGTGWMLFEQTSKVNQEKYLNKQTADLTDFGIGSSVHVEVIHSPTNTILYSKDVIVA